MRVKKMTGSICYVEATFVVRNIRDDEVKFDRVIDFNIDLDDIGDLANYNIFLPDGFLNQNLDDVINDTPFYDEDFVIALNDLTRSVLLDNVDKVEGHLRDESRLDENEEIIDIYDVNVFEAFDLRVLEGEILTVLSADVDVQGSVTRQRFKGVEYREYVDDSCGCEQDYYLGITCNCEQGYYEEGIHKEFIKEETFELSDSSLTDIDISDIDINDKESLINRLKQAYREDVVDTFNTSYEDADGERIFNETTVEILKFTLNSMKIKRTLLTVNSDIFSVDFN